MINANRLETYSLSKRLVGKRPRTDGSFFRTFTTSASLSQQIDCKQRCTVLVPTWSSVPAASRSHVWPADEFRGSLLNRTRDAAPESKASRFAHGSCVLIAAHTALLAYSSGPGDGMRTV